jgi:NAD(P)H dehydrogenase (quinone)
MKIAVTAASGKLGSEICKATISLVGKDNVVGLARTPSKAEHLGIKIRPGDYNARDDLTESFESVDTVLLVSGMDEPAKRIDQHRNVITAAREAGAKKIVYTSVQGPEEGSGFSPIIQSNRQTEADIRTSGLDWVVGRNGIYIEPDIAYMESYKTRGGIYNCAEDGKCGYTTRAELAYAYARMLTQGQHNGKTYNLHGEAITQQQLADYLNAAFGTRLAYHRVSQQDYRRERTGDLGEFIGTIIAGIYQGIRDGYFDNPSQYAEAAGREHQSWDTYFALIKK